MSTKVIIPLTTLTILLVQQVFSQTTTFQFLPKNGGSFVERKEREVVIETIGSSQRQTNHDSGASDWSILRYRDHWLFVERNGPLSSQKDGKPFPTVANKLLAGLIVTNRVSTDGRLIEITPNKDVLSEAKRVFPTNYHALLEREINPQALTRMERTRWDELVTPFVNRTVRQGEMWRDNAYVRVSDARPGPTKMERLTFFPKIYTEGGVTLVKVLVIACSHTNVLAQFDFQGSESINDPAIRQFLDFSDLRINVEKLCVERVVEADTMTCRAETEMTQSNWGLQRKTDTLQRSYGFR